MSQILIVEDSERIASFVAKGLRSAGYVPTVVGTTREAIDLSSTGEFALMVLDLGLPDGEGMSVARHVRSIGSTMAIIILTARDSVTDTVAGLEGGADDYMAKPFRFEELLARVRLRLRGTGSEEITALSRGDLELGVDSASSSKKLPLAAYSPVCTATSRTWRFAGTTPASIPAPRRSV